METMIRAPAPANRMLANVGPALAQVHVAAAEPKTLTVEASQKTTTLLRDLWLSHIFWVRNVCLSYFNKNDIAMKVAEEQVLANAQSLAVAIEPFYGALAKEGLFKLLADHYGAIRAYLIANAAGDDSGIEAATQLLTSNTQEIAMFLSEANPNLPKDAITGLLREHDSHHIKQIQELKEHKFEAEAKTWENMKAHIYATADAIGGALAQQFAKKS
jgi:hypothetical protein